MDTVAIVIGLTIFFAVLLFLGGPEFLRWQAGRNRDRYELVIPALKAMEEALRATAARLRHYRPLEALVYQETYNVTRQPMERAVEAFRAAQQQQEQLHLPAVDEEGLAIRHFFQHPDQLVAIPRDAARLARMQGYLTRARRSLQAVNEGLNKLSGVPALLRERAGKLVHDQLQPLAATLSSEEAEGIAALGRWQTRQEKLAEEAEALLQQLRDDPNQPLAQLDTLAQTVDRLEKAAVALAAEVDELVSDRQVVDEQVERTRATYDRIAQREARPLAPLLARSERLLEEVSVVRREAEFEAAGERLAEARALLALASDLAEVAEKVKALEIIADVSLEAGEIAELVEGQQRIHAMIGERLTLSTDGAPSEKPGGPAPGLPTPEMQVVDLLQRQTREMEARAERLLSLHEAHVRELEEEASREEQRLNQAWQRLAQILPPEPGEPLANHYHQIQRQRAEAVGKPTVLRAYVGAARGLATQLTDTAAYLEENLQWATGLRQEIANLLAAAEETAGDWFALQGYVTEIKESAAAIWQVDPADAGNVDSAYDALDELQARQEQALDAWEALNAGRQRLAAVEERIERTEAALQAEAVDPAEWERVEQLVQGHYTDALRAGRVEEALVSLQEVHDVLREISVQT